MLSGYRAPPVQTQPGFVAVDVVSCSPTVALIPSPRAVAKCSKLAINKIGANRLKKIRGFISIRLQVEVQIMRGFIRLSHGRRIRLSHGKADSIGGNGSTGCL